MTQAEIQALSEKIAPIAEKYGVERVKLFGSRARGDNRPDSDYDFLIGMGKIRSLIQLCGFELELEDILHTHVDVITDTCNDPKFVFNAENEGLLVYGY